MRHAATSATTDIWPRIAFEDPSPTISVNSDGAPNQTTPQVSAVNKLVTGTFNHPRPIIDNQRSLNIVPKLYRDHRVRLLYDIAPYEVDR